jgi:hypothetical protein
MPRASLVTLFLGVAFLGWCARYGPGAVRQRGANEAIALSRAIKPKLAADPRFARVSMMVWTHPTLEVMGEVPDEKALQDLNRLVQLPPDAHFHLFMHVTAAQSEVERARTVGATDGN